MISERNATNDSARDEIEDIAQNHVPTPNDHAVRITTADINGVTYIVEHETSRTARETPLEKVKKLILRDAENLKKYNGRRAEMT